VTTNAVTTNAVTTNAVTTNAVTTNAVTNILLVEPYYSGSHRSWADGWVANSRHNIGLVTHEAEFWRWRMRGGAVTLAEDALAWVGDHGVPDLLVVSDMIDLAGFLGYTRRVLGHVPVVLYMHENQLLYPLGPTQQPDEGFSLINWRAMVAADAIWFNSAFQRDGLFEVLPKFLNHQADHKHTHLIDTVTQASSVHPVGVDTASLIDAGRGAPGPAPLVLWNQRWDHDKNPSAVFQALVQLADAGVPFTFALAGENQRVDPQEFDRVQNDLGDRVVHVGHLPRCDYRSLLLRSDVVVSAANHEFFGISVVEAIAAGAVPVLPNRLSYPEVVPREWHPGSIYPDGGLRVRLEQVLLNLDAARADLGGLRESMRQYDWSVIAPRYDDAVDEVLSRA